MTEPGGFGEAHNIYRAQGWLGTVPLNGKILAVKGVSGKEGRWPTSDELDTWRTRFADHNIALRLPKGIIGLDIDAYDSKRGGETLAEWEGRLGALPPTWRSSARDDRISGIRFYRLDDLEAVFPSDLGEHSGIEIVQFHHRYSVVWPSRHPDLGSTYHWYDPHGIARTDVPAITELTTLPREWETALRTGSSDPTAEPGAVPGGTGSLLSSLLAAPPRAAGSRNNWMTRVAGHIAKGKLHADGYEELLIAVNRGLNDPMDENEVRKTARSIWQAEQASKSPERALPKQETGWLIGGGDHLLVAVKDKEGDGVRVEECSDFDIEVIGKYTDQQFNTFYKVRLKSRVVGQDRYMTESAAMFGNGKTLRQRLSSLECNIWAVPGDMGARQSQQPINRLGHYVSTQEAPTLEVVPHMGWHDKAGGFVCDEGVITSKTVQPETAFVLDPMVRTRDPLQNKYGFEGDWATAQHILNEVLTYQDESVTSVFGAWWAACFIKPMLMNKASFFPFMAIEAMSGTGKTEGFFNLMVQLNGATRLGSHQTAAAFRDSMASNRSGIIWIDDLDDATSVYQDIRTATNEETRSKKAADNTATTSVKLVAPVLITGEALPGISDQKALLDRLVRLDVPPARNRQSMRGDREQWLDIVELREKHPTLWSYSGWYVQHALLHAADVMSEWPSLRPTGQGRHGDKVATLKVGARLLAALTGDDNHINRVDYWTGTMEQTVGDFLVNRIIPEYLRANLIPTSPLGWQGAFVDKEGTVWWHIGRLSDWWLRERRGLSDRERSFGTTATMENHRTAMGITSNMRRKYKVSNIGETYNQQNYYPCPPEISAQILRMAGIDQATPTVLVESP